MDKRGALSRLLLPAFWVRHVFPSLNCRGPQMSYRHVVSFVTLLFLEIVALPASRLASAADGFQPISPEELKMTSEPQAPGAPAIILIRQVDRDDNGSTSHEYNYFRIKILTEEGRKHADIEIPFFKQQGNIVNIRARTIRPDGSVANFDGKIYEKPIVKAKGHRQRHLHQ